MSTPSGSYQPPASGPFVAAFEASRIDLLRRVVRPMWKRAGWEPRPHGPTDPQDEARVYATLPAPSGSVAVPLSLLRALVERKECGSLREFHADEDGPHSWTTYARCRIAEGHDGQHSNGYHRWPNVDHQPSATGRSGGGA